MKEKYLIITTGEDADDTGVLFVQAESHEDALMTFLIDRQDFLLDKDENPEDREEEYIQVNRMLGEMPIGVAQILGHENENPEIEWFYELP